MKTTATLLIAIFMISIFAVAITVSADTQVIVIEEGRENYAGPVVDLDDTEDPYSTLDNIILEVSDVGDFMVFTITTPPGMIGSTLQTYSGSVVFIIDEDADGTTDWQVSYEPGSQMWTFIGVWGYEDGYDEDGNPPSPRNFEDATLRNDIAVSRDGDKFILSVSNEKLGGPGSDFRFGIYISHLTEYHGGIPGGAPQVMIFFPYYDLFSWADTTDFPTGTVPMPPTRADFVPGIGKGLNKAPPNDNFAKGLQD